MRRPAIAATLLFAVAAFVLGACGGDDDPGDTLTRTPAATPTPSASGTPTGDIRAVALDEVADVQSLVGETSGQFAQQDVIYADLTGDGADEAVVPISAGGTLGAVAFIVLAAEGDDATRTLLRERPSGTGGLAVAVEGEDLVVTEPVPGPDDPECCPSQLRVTTYAWDGSALAQASQETIPNPDGGAKPTTPP